MCAEAPRSEAQPAYRAAGQGARGPQHPGERRAAHSTGAARHRVRAKTPCGLLGRTRTLTVRLGAALHQAVAVLRKLFHWLHGNVHHVHGDGRVRTAHAARCGERVEKAGASRRSCDDLRSEGRAVAGFALAICSAPPTMKPADLPKIPGLVYTASGVRVPGKAPCALLHTAVVVRAPGARLTCDGLCAQNPGPRSQGLRFVNGYAVVGEAIPIQGAPAREAPPVAAPAPSAPAAVAPGTSTQPGWLVNDKKARELPADATCRLARRGSTPKPLLVALLTAVASCRSSASTPGSRRLCPTTPRCRAVCATSRSSSTWLMARSR